MKIDVGEISVLVVDDEKTSLRILERLLRRQGYRQVSISMDGTDALSKLQGGLQVDLILCDLIMPDMDGMTLIKRVRSELESGQQYAIVMLSGEEDTETVRQCLEAGADSYLRKPIREQYVMNVWENVWRKRLETSMRSKLRLDEENLRRMENQMTGMEVSMELMQRKYLEAVEVPVNALIGTLRSLLAQGDLSPAVRTALGTVIDQLMCSNHFSPHMRTQVGELGLSMNSLDNQHTLDDDTRRWLMQEMVRGDDPAKKTARPIEEPVSVEIVAHVLPNEPTLALWTFDERMYPDDAQFLGLSEVFFESLQLLERLELSRSALRGFLRWARSAYRRNPYHNWRHAFDVTQAAYVMLTTEGVAERLSALEIFCVLVACISHDLDHNGVNNAFHVQTASDLALLYNDSSVLENHHASMLFRHMREVPADDIFASLSKPDQQEARKLILQLVLATDLSQHFGIVGQMQLVEKLDATKCEHRLLLCKAVVKCADISNQCRSWALASRWTFFLQEEFFRQGDAERARELTVSSFMDRAKPDTRKMVLNFINFIARPLNAEMLRWLPAHSVPVAAMEANFEQWGAIDESSLIVPNPSA